MNLAFDIDPSVLASVRRDPEEFVRELRLAAAVKWYECGILTQEKAAAVAGLSRTEFISSLARFGVSPFQETKDEILAVLK